MEGLEGVRSVGGAPSPELKTDLGVSSREIDFAR